MRWHPELTVKGHFSDVSDMSWDEHEIALITTSLDQTTRIFSEHNKQGSWFEVGRPQIHGYDMNAICCVRNKATGNDNEVLSSKILSGGDEKVLRLFEAPYNFVKTMNSLNPHIKTGSLP